MKSSLASAAVQQLKFSSVRSVELGLKRMKATPRDHVQIVAASFAASPRKGRMAARALVNVSTNLDAVRQIVLALRQSGDANLRRETVKAYTDAHKQLELITGLSTLTPHDAAPFFRDYFASGGKLRDVSDWLASMSALAAQPRRSTATRRTGFFSDVGAFFNKVGKAIADAIESVFDAIIEAGKAFVEVIGEVLTWTQDKINALIAALIAAGKAIGEFVVDAVQRGLDAAKKIFTALLAAGKKVRDILRELYNNIPSAFQLGLQALRAIGRTVVEILSEAVALSLDILSEAVQKLINLGTALADILMWAVGKTVDVLKIVIQALLQIGKTLADVVNWAVTRALAIVQKVFQVLLALGYAIGAIVVALVTLSPTNLKKALRALKQLGATAKDLLYAVINLPSAIVQKIYAALLSIGFTLAGMLDSFVALGEQMFKELLRLLLRAGVALFNLVLWAAQKAFEFFSWVMEVADELLADFVDLLTAAAALGGPVVSQLARWLAETGRQAVEWFKNKVIVPILAVGKLALVIAFALVNVVFLALAYFILKSVVDESKTDYHHWPATFAAFKSAISSKLITLPDVDAAHRYVVISDLHAEAQADVDAGIGHFFQNDQLLRNVMAQYAADRRWSVLVLGDGEEFWYSNDLALFEAANKVNKIVDAHTHWYAMQASQFYNQQPRRYFKFRGNHDDLYATDALAVSRFRARGFANLPIYDYALLKRNGRDILLMHGMQFDPYNCDANNSFGKFVSNFVAEPLDALNDTLVSIFGDGARIEGGTLGAVAPYYTRDQWLSLVDGVPPDANHSTAAHPNITKGFTFDEHPVAAQIGQFGCSLIIGHTHEPKLMTRAGDPNLFYVNSGTCGWWAGCVWTVEITAEDVALKAWTAESLPQPFRVFPLSQCRATFSVDASKQK